MSKRWFSYFGAIALLLGMTMALHAPSGSAQTPTATVTPNPYLTVCNYQKNQTNHAYTDVATNWVDQDNPTVNHSGSATISIQNKDSSDLHQKQAYFRAVVSNVPTGKVFVDAWLCVYMPSGVSDQTTGAPYGWTSDVNGQSATWNSKPTSTGREKCSTNIGVVAANAPIFRWGTVGQGGASPSYYPCFGDQMTNINSGNMNGNYNFAIIGGDGALLTIPGAGDTDGNQPFIDIQYKDA